MDKKVEAVGVGLVFHDRHQLSVMKGHHVANCLCEGIQQTSAFVTKDDRVQKGPLRYGEIIDLTHARLLDLHTRR